jgi:hypothetical protein
MAIAITVIIVLVWLWLSCGNFMSVSHTAGQATQVHGSEHGGLVAWAMFLFWELIWTAIAVVLLVWIW